MPFPSLIDKVTILEKGEGKKSPVVMGGKEKKGAFFPQKQAVKYLRTVADIEGKYFCKLSFLFLILPFFRKFLLRAEPLFFHDPCQFQSCP